MTEDTPYHMLANAIVEQAADDLRKATRNFKKGKKLDKAERDIQEILRFFYSDYFRLLTKLDPDLIVRRILNEE